MDVLSRVQSNDGKAGRWEESIGVRTTAHWRRERMSYPFANQCDIAKKSLFEMHQMNSGCWLVLLLASYREHS
jgi:hypothetical protein